MIAVVTAIGSEVRAFLREGEFALAEELGGVRFLRSARMPGVVVAEGGMGRERADAACRLSVERYRPDLIVSAGFAGAARPGARAGDLLVCTRLWSLTGAPETWRVDRAVSHTLIDAGAMGQLADALGAIEGGWGECVTVDRLCAESDRKAWLGRSLGVDLVDLESYWVSEAAAELGLPHLVVRAVLDAAEVPLPPYAVRAAERPDLRSPRAAAAHVLGHPAEIPSLMRLWRCAARASFRLGRALTAVVTADEWTAGYRLKAA